MKKEEKMKVKAVIEKLRLCTGHEVYHATLPTLPGPIPICYGEGKTEKEAITDLNHRIKKDGFGDIYIAV